MIRFPCAGCERVMNAADEHAGKKAKCPSCGEIVVIPQRSILPAPAKAAPARTAPTKPPPGAVSRKPQPASDVDDDDAPRRKPAPARAKSRPVEEDDEDIPEVEAVDDDDDYEEAEEIDEEEERPKKKKKKSKKRRSRSGEYADCPNCGCPGDAFRVYYSFWWGFLPSLVNHVQCRDCGTQYNGKNGGYNTVTFLLIQGVIVVIAVGLMIVGAVVEAMGP